jgi:hypothetical protein
MTDFYAPLYERVWRDGDVRRLSPGAKLLFLWSWTNGQLSRLTGFTEATPAQLRRADALRSWPYEPAAPEPDAIDQATMDVLLEELAHKPLCLYDAEHGLLWCISRLRFMLSTDAADLSRGQFERLVKRSRSPLVALARERYPALIR